MIESDASDGTKCLGGLAQRVRRSQLVQKAQVLPSPVIFGGQGSSCSMKSKVLVSVESTGLRLQTVASERKKNDINDLTCPFERVPRGG